MTTEVQPTVPAAPPERPPRRRPGRRWPASRLALWIAVSMVAVLAVALGLVVIQDGDGTGPATTQTTAATASTTTTSTTTIPPTTTAPPDTSTAIWPDPSDPTRYADPVDAAKAFATDYLGFTAPRTSEFMAGDSRSGEVEIRPDATGPATTVFVRQLTDDASWWVLGAATDNIRLESPSALETISSPVELRGTSTAFEANVSIAIYADGHDEPLVEGSVMGGANGEFGPFAGSFQFATPSTDAGAIVLFTRSMKDGAIREATAIRVRFN